MSDGNVTSFPTDRNLAQLPQVASAVAALRPLTRERRLIPKQFKWRLEDIYPSWEEWDAELKETEDLAGQFAALKETLGSGAEAVARAFGLSEELGKRFQKLGAYAHLSFDVDQRNNGINAYQQRVRILGARVATALSWFTPELLTIPQETMEQWIDATPALHPHRFPIRELYRLQAHVLDEPGEKLLSFARRLSHAPTQAYEMLSTADVRWPSITLESGAERTLSPASYAEILDTERNQADRRKAFERHYEVYLTNANTYAALYDAVCQRDLFIAQSRNYCDTLALALEEYAAPAKLYANLIEVTRAGVEPLQRYYRLRKTALGLDHYDLYDGAIPLVTFDQRYPYETVQEHITRSVAPLGRDYQRRVEEAFRGGWIDVYESEGKRSGAYSSGVYGVHPYMLLNYNDTLDMMFTLAHEMGHSIHTLLAHETQPYPTAGYTIFVAEVASTMNERLLLEHLLQVVDDPVERAVLLEHSIDQIVGTFYGQVRLADFEREAHRLVEEGRPVTAEVLNDLYYRYMRDYYGDSAELNELYRVTWARVPHFFRTPYYVYQYATSFAASSALYRDIMPPSGGTEAAAQPSSRDAAVERYLNLLRSGGSDHPMEQLRLAGVDLRQPNAIQAVIDLFDRRVNQLDAALADLPH